MPPRISKFKNTFRQFAENWIVTITFRAMITAGLFLLSAILMRGKDWATTFVNEVLSANPRISVTLQATDRIEKSYEQIAESAKAAAHQQEAIQAQLEAQKTSLAKLTQAEQESRLRLSLLEQDLKLKREDDKVWQQQILNLLRQTPRNGGAADHP